MSSKVFIQRTAVAITAVLCLAALVHHFSSVLVVLNSARLARGKAPVPTAPSNHISA